MIDDTLAKMPTTEAAADFVTTLNSLHPNLSFTMELPVDNKIPFIGMEIIKNGTQIETQVYRKPSNTGLLLHLQSHTDNRYKDCLLKTMIYRAHTFFFPLQLMLSINWCFVEFFYSCCFQWRMR